MARQLSRTLSSIRGFASGTKEFTLPSLPYDYNALEPYLSADILKVHHQKHHQTYINNLNNFAKQTHEAANKGDFHKVVALQKNLQFNYGGHINHAIYWENLAPAKSGGGGTPTGDLAKSIQKDFGSFEKFQEKFNQTSVAVQGSGWGWLGFNKESGRLEITTKKDQEVLFELEPLLIIDVWEHAYYLQYKNVRADYLKQVWNVINWKEVSNRFDKARS